MACAFLVGTFAHDVTKQQCVRRVSAFMKWLHRRLPGHQIEYAATYELTEKGRLHVNLVIGDWRCIPRNELEQKWGAFMTASLIGSRQDNGGDATPLWTEDEAAALRVAREVAKSGPERVANYMAKFDQAVNEGKGVSYSQGWPKVAKREAPQRVGDIRWSPIFRSDLAGYEIEMRQGKWVREAGEMRRPIGHPDHNPNCRCFEFQSKKPKGAAPGDDHSAKPRPSQGPTINMEALQ